MSKLSALKRVFASPLYIAIAAAAAAAYYLILFYLVASSNYGFFLLTAPASLVYSLILSGAVLLSLSVYASRNARGLAGAEGEALSLATSVAGGLISSCACATPILSSLLYGIGLGVAQVTGIVIGLGTYQAPFLAMLIAINLAFIYYQLSRIEKARKRR